MASKASVEGREARDHLAELDQAVKAATVASFDPGSPRLWMLLALLGPAAIWGVTLGTGIADERFKTLLFVGAVLFGVVGAASLLALELRNRKGGVRAKAPIRGGPRPTKWMFGATISMITPPMIAVNLVSINGVNRPFLLGGLLFVWLAVVPGYCYRRHAATLGHGRLV